MALPAHGALVDHVLNGRLHTSQISIRIQKTSPNVMALFLWREFPAYATATFFHTAALATPAVVPTQKMAPPLVGVVSHEISQTRPTARR